MSVWDERLLEIAAQRRADAIPTPVDDDAPTLGGNGFGALAGAFLIGIGVLGLPVSGGLSIAFIIGGCFCFGGGKITDDTWRARHAAASQGDVEGANRASASGCGSLIGYIVISAILGALIIAGVMGGMGL